MFNNISPKVKNKQNHNQPDETQINKSMKQLSAQTIRQAIELVLDKVTNSRIDNANGCHWPNANENQSDPTISDCFFYDGLSGILLIYYYAGIILWEEKYFKIAAKTLATILWQIERASDDQLTQLAPGAFAGLAGILYSFNKINPKLLGHSITDSVQRILQRLEHSLEKTNVVDIFSGSAGCLAVLNACPELIEDDSRARLTEKCCQHILHHCPSPHTLLNTTHQQNQAFGFAHGLSGITWSLANFSPKRYNLDIQKWIEQALQIIGERQYNHTAITWQNGISGMFMALNNIPHFYKTKTLGDVSKVMLKKLSQENKLTLYNLSQGMLGNLMIIEQGTSSDNLTQHHLTQIVSTILNNKYICNASDHKSTQAGLMTGETGIAYFLLRQLDHELIENILLLKCNCSP